jgi:pilus assembly protein Flp/PilA
MAVFRTVALLDGRPAWAPTISNTPVLAQGRSNIMKTLANKVRRFLVSEDGPTAVEYAVMLALIIIVCLAAIQAVGTNANTTFTNVGNALQGTAN